MQKEEINLIKYSGAFNAEHYSRQIANVEIEATSSDVDGLIAHYIDAGDGNSLSPCKLLDTNYYYEVNPDVAASDMTALFHFLKYGWKELRNPHPLFDTQFVLGQMTDKSANPLIQYMNSPPGTINPHRLVDENYILRQLTDMGIAVTNVLIDFLDYNIDDINPSHEFDTLRYLAAYPDLRNASKRLNALYHYVRYGKRESRWIFHDSASLVGLERQLSLISSIEPNIIPPHVNPYELPFSYSKSTGVGFRKTLLGLSTLIGAKPFEYIFFLSSTGDQTSLRALENFINSLTLDEQSTTIGVMISDHTKNAALDSIQSRVNFDIVDVSDFDSIEDASHFDAALKFLAMTLTISRCENICTLNSDLGWNLMKYYGAVLSQHKRLHGFAFSYEYDQYKRRFGYAWTHLRDCLPFLSSVIIDNAPLAQQLALDLKVSPKEIEKFIVARQSGWSTPGKTLTAPTLENPGQASR